MKQTGVDPEYQRYRQSYPKFPGVSACVELLRNPNVKGAYLDGVMSDLQERASKNMEDILAAFRAETDSRVRTLLLSVIAETRSQAALPIFAEALLGDNEELQVWAARGLHVLDTPDARKLLWEAGSRRLATREATQRFQQMLEEVAKWK
jgi:hypothetical protein